MNSRISKLLISVGLIFMLSSCLYDILYDIGELSQNNAEYLLDEYDSLIYLYNQTDTCKVSVKSKLSKGYVDIHSYTGLGYASDDSGSSYFYLPDSIYKVTLIVSGEDDKISLHFYFRDKKNTYFNSTKEFMYFTINKSEFTNNITIQNINYKDCYEFDIKTSSDSSNISIQKFFYNKEYGLVQLIMKDSTRFELIGAK